MGNYAVIQQINGAFAVIYEGSDANQMEVNFYNHIAAILNDPAEAIGVVKMVDGNLDVFDGCIKIINKPAKNA